MEGFMKTYSYKEHPIKVFGVVDFEKKGKIQRLPDELIEKIPRLSKLGRRCTGARLCFKTDSQSIKIRITFETLSMDVGMSIYLSPGAVIGPPSFYWDGAGGKGHSSWAPLSVQRVPQDIYSCSAPPSHLISDGDGSPGSILYHGFFVSPSFQC